eukprot:SAG25_NODE_2848_length_1352_cov_3.217877_4_plen_40_part_01
MASDRIIIRSGPCGAGGRHRPCTMGRLAVHHGTWPCTMGR